MKTIARMALEPGMELAEDVLNSKNEVIVPAHTKVDDAVIAKLARYSVMVVSITEAIDYATTHYERIRLSPGFKQFEQLYLTLLPEYKDLMNKLVYYGIPVDSNDLLRIYHTLADSVGSNNIVLDYLYNMMPNEDELTHTHCLNSALIAGAFASWLSMTPADTQMLILCAFYYDIGKLKLPNSLLWKSGKLTDVEFAQIKTHPFLGFDLVKDQEHLDPHILKSILMHHERCDGKGYPSRLKMHQIDIFARHIAIIDAYEAMTSPRAYRASLTPLQVIERFEKSGMMQYDMDILKPIMKRLADSQVGLTAKLNDESVWDIFMVNPLALSRPILKRLSDQTGQMEVLDLMQNKDFKIVNIL